MGWRTPSRQKIRSLWVLLCQWYCISHSWTAQVSPKVCKKIEKAFKGQLISKCLFGIFNSPKKQSKKFDFTCYLKSNCFRSFFWRIEVKTPKRYFEINWPLLCIMNTNLIRRYCHNCTLVHKTLVVIVFFIRFCPYFSTKCGVLSKVHQLSPLLHQPGTIKKQGRGNTKW